MKNKILSTILIMVMLFTATVMSMPEAVFAATTTELPGSTDTDPADEKTAYQTFDVKAPKGSVVIVESIDGKDTYAGGVVGSTGKKEYGPSIFSDGIEEFFKNPSPKTYLSIGDYYYKISLKDLGVAGVNYDKREYTVWVHIQYKDEAGTGKEMSIVLQETDGNGNVIHTKPDDIEFENTKEETMVIKRTIKYRENTKDGTPMTEVTGDSEFEDFVQHVYLKRTVKCDSNGNTLDESKNEPWEIDTAKTNDYSNKTSPTADGYNHFWAEAPSDASNKKDVVDWFKPSDPTGSGSPTSDYAKYLNKIDLNNPKDVVEHVIYTKRPSREETEEITIKRTIYYKEYTRDNLDSVYRKEEQTVTLTRTKIYYADGAEELISTGPWSIKDSDTGYGEVISKDHPGSIDYPKGKWKHRWDTMDGTENDGMPDVMAWDDPKNPNKIDLTNPRDQEEWVIYTPIGTHTETETRTIKRTIYYKYYNEDGEEVWEPVEQTITVKRTKTIWDDGTVKDEGKWEYASGDHGYVISKSKDGWNYDRNVVPDWDDPDNPNRIDWNDPKDQIEYVIYNPRPTEEIEETITITRTITYTKYTEDGEEIHVTYEQKVVLKRKVKRYTDGDKEEVPGSRTPWTIDEENSDTSAIKSPDKDGWVPNTDLVSEWEIDLLNPKSEVVHVIYVPADQPPTPLPPVETEEFMTITRTITYTEYTADGKEVSKTVVQTVTLRRIKTENPDGTVSYSKWEIAEGDQSAIDSPQYPGWTPDRKSVSFWDIDLDNPQSVVIHVIYTPKDVIKTGDENNLLLWGGIAGGAVLAAILLLILKKRGNKSEK